MCDSVTGSHLEGEGGVMGRTCPPSHAGARPRPLASSRMWVLRLSPSCTCWETATSQVPPVCPWLCCGLQTLGADPCGWETRCHLCKRGKDTGPFQRKTWQELSQEYIASASLDPAVQDTIDVIEGRSWCHLLSRVRALCQSLLRDHFGKKDKNLVQALWSLKQSLEDCGRRSCAPMSESLVESVYMAVFGEYVQALVSHLQKQKPRKWGNLRDQVDTDTSSLYSVFREHGGPGLAEVRGPIMEPFLPGKDERSQVLDSWLASFSDRFPGFLRPGAHRSSPPAPKQTGRITQLQGVEGGGSGEEKALLLLLLIPPALDTVTKRSRSRVLLQGRQ
ncbi:uncharacterized protein LOC105304439 isoform X2 [Pteropus vampyrus]|uniref:Uncharacterized protein LOC105304439 isoform X2 n=1 Tax=Pteropus vampyrus TaxID=132908 RepID=A0A6P3RG51_PTEVA|nr:uncharacterized protein LOC105304439 isoform X2 [Pteropus vampyrus]